MNKILLLLLIGFSAQLNAREMTKEEKKVLMKPLIEYHQKKIYTTSIFKKLLWKVKEERFSIIPSLGYSIVAGLIVGLIYKLKYKTDYITPLASSIGGFFVVFYLLTMVALFIVSYTSLMNDSETEAEKIVNEIKL